MASKRLRVFSEVIEFVLIFIFGAILGELLVYIGCPPFYDDLSFNPFALVAITGVVILIANGDWSYPKE